MSFYSNLFIVFLIISVGIEVSESLTIRRQVCRLECSEYCQTRGKPVGRCSRSGDCICQRTFLTA